MALRGFIGVGSGRIQNGVILSRVGESRFFEVPDCMIRKDNAPQNLSLLKKIVLNLIRADKTDTAKTSLRLKRKRAAWDDDIRMKMLGIQPL